MLSDKKGKTIKEFVEAFRDLGYFCHYEVLNTKDYGVPQNRERIFLVGFKNKEHYYNFSFAPKMKLEKRLKDILEDSVDEKFYFSNEKVIWLENYPRKINRGTNETEYSNCLISGYYKIPGDGFYIKEKVSKNIKPSVRSNFERDYEKIVNSDKDIFYCECDS
jgi:site-specific DNA-cytosine methylase